jgi:hypothetical protein
LEGKDPEIRPHVPDYFGKPGVSQRGITKPAYGRRPPGEEPTEVQNNSTANETPKAQGVHTGESDVSGSDLKGHDEIEEGGAQWHDDEENHGGSMHREHLVVLTVGENFHVVIPQLRTDKQCLDSTQQKKEQSGQAIHHSNFFVVDGGEPIDYACGMLTGSREDLGL